MKLNKCQPCRLYTLKNTCPKCKEEVKSAHYKFTKILNAKNNE